jgi:transcription elongation GreA/GreB family factor
MARALLKKTIDDDIVVNTPGGDDEYQITHVSYQAPPPDQG